MKISGLLKSSREAKVSNINIYIGVGKLCWHNLPGIIDMHKYLRNINYYIGINLRILISYY